MCQGNSSDRAYRNRMSILCKSYNPLIVVSKLLYHVEKTYTVKHFISNVFYYTFFIIICACNKNNEFVQSNSNDDSKTEFVQQEIDAFYENSNPTGQWKIIRDVVEANYKNTADVENWLNRRLNEKFVNEHGFSGDLISSINLGLIAYDLNEFSRDMAYFSLNTDIGKRDKKVQATALFLLSSHFRLTNQLDSLTKYNDLLFDFIELEDCHPIPVGYYANKAEIAEKNGDFFGAVLNTHKAIELTEQDDVRNLTTLYHNLALIHLNIDNIKKAAQYIDLSVKQTGLDDYPPDLLSSLAVIQSKAKLFEKAEITFQKVFEFAHGDPLLLARAYSNFGNLKRRKGEFEDAFHFFEKSDSICEKMNMDFGIMINQINRAEVYFDQKLFQKAEIELQRAKKTCLEINDIRILKEFYDLEYRVNDSLANVLKANEYFRLFTETKDAYFGDLPRTILAEWELSNLEAISDKNKFELERRLQQENTKMLVISFVLITLVLFGLLLYLVNKRKIAVERWEMQLDKQKMAFELETKSKELLSNTLSNISIATTKESIAEELESIVEKLPKSHQSSFTALIKNMRLSNQEAIFDEFKARFTGVHEGFYLKLKLMAPDLSVNELNVCALIKLKMSTKEIAVLTNRTPGTIENIRSSIRKKLNLSNEDSLQEELMKLF